MALPQTGATGAADAQLTVYTVPTSPAAVAAITVNVCALVACSATIYLVPPSTTIGNSHKIENARPLQVSDVIERTGIVVPAGWRVIVSANVANALAVQVWGIEETA